MMIMPRLDILGAALADSSRARMLCALMDGRAHTNKELAATAAISPQTASAHLKRLQQTGLSVSLRSGRHVYHRIAGPEVAEALERLACLSPPDHLSRPHTSAGRAGGDMRLARRCYNHLAGRLGVHLAQRLCAMDVLIRVGDSLHAGPHHAAFCHALGLPGGSGARAAQARLCLDWTERRFHLSGPLATAFLDRALSAGWLVAARGQRALTISEAGYETFASAFGLSRAAIAQEPERFDH